MALLAAVLAVELVGLGFFVKGFFPYKRSIPGFASVQDQPESFAGGSPQEPPAPQYDRLVVMLVDALRNDFVFGNNSAMAYTQGLLRDGRAVGYTAKALAPTVTMPRIKALMTGTVPNFLDAVLNIAESDTSSSLKFQDNLLWQLKNRGKAINMFGDDTWLRLFPDVFSRTDGTSSFFVTDTVEVDANVTRNVRPELERDGWDVTIFHYLGLDHIGHLAGPDSPLMRPKQEEMDHVVRDILEIVSAQDVKRLAADSSARPTLFVLLGDHAMNEIGNHGGNSHLETSTVFVFVGEGIRGQPIADKGRNALSALLTNVVPQINLVPTLALLFGVPVPKNNLGLPLPELIAGYSDGERLRLLQIAAHQIYGVVLANDPDLATIDIAKETAGDAMPTCDSDHDPVSMVLRCEYIRALTAHKRFTKARPGSAAGAAAAAAAATAEGEYYSFMGHANAHLSRTFSGYDLNAMSVGIALFCVSTMLLVALYQASSSGIANFKTKRIIMSVPAIALLVTYVISLNSSSLIEEEHQFWYHWVQTMFFLRLLTSRHSGGVVRTFFQMCLFRIARAWNQTGQNWPGEIDIRYYLNSSYNRLMWFMVLVTFALFGVCASWIHRSAASAESLRRSKSGAPSIHVGRSRYRRRLAYGQRIFRGVLSTALANALVYQMERNGGWQVVGLSQPVWSVVRWFTPSELADVARFVYLLTFAAALLGTGCAWLRRRSGVSDHAVLVTAALEGLVGLLPLLLLLARPHNIPVFAIFVAMFVLFFPQLLPRTGFGRKGSVAVQTAGCGPAEVCSNEWRLSALRPSKALVLLCLVHASFFVLGNSNSLASLDLSNAYAGVSRYNEGLVGVLLFTANWAGPLWWAAAGFATLALSAADDTAAGPEDGRMQRLLGWIVAAHLWQAATILVLSVVVTLMRTHLFIWSVFSPRYLYQIAWFAGFYLAAVTAGGTGWLAALLATK
ncbi:major facilitator super transporter protein [Coemansia interrupta]|uniref:GPI ethanolamine phosphate transferase 2 n=1 Tax=Coemansia interrupta TaxID=1126814 RepID=A0A9W8HK55_9FUNG|nr:major facilitator super transporter protein [Coemansia interrupta]